MKRKLRGFTIVELNLALIFVALLLIGIAALTMHVSRIYQRGVMIKDTNQIGREVFAQMQSDIAGATPSAVKIEAGANSGRICLGNASYLYNTAAGLEAGSGLLVRGATGSSPAISLVRVNDPTQRWCQKSSPTTFTLGPDVSDAFIADNAAELIARDNFAPIAIHSLELQQYGSAAVDKQALYNLKIRLGTAKLDIITSGNCNPPSHSQSDFDACFVIDYATVIRAGNIGGV